MINVSLDHFFVLSLILFVIGLIGFSFNRKSFINVLFSLEIMFMACNLNFVAGSTFFDNISGQIFAIIILAILAVELAIGLTIALLLVKKNQMLNIEEL